MAADTHRGNIMEAFTGGITEGGLAIIASMAGPNTSQIVRKVINTI